MPTDITGPEQEHEAVWPRLPFASWSATAATLHMWTQIVGKIRLALSPHVNHWWEVPLYVSARGLSTSAIPYQQRLLELEFDFIAHNLAIRDSSGANRYVPLYDRSVADFYQELTAVLHAMSIDVRIWRKPVEIPDPIPFPDDTVHASYDPVAARRFHRILMSVHSVLNEFRGPFLGKASPVHFFWGSFDLAATRFSGRRAPKREGADVLTREAYSHESSSDGFWHGGPMIYSAFYSYTVPEPQGYSQYAVRPAEAFYHPELKEFVLMYEDVRSAPSPERKLLEFLQTTYEAGAILGKWDRSALEQNQASQEV